MRIERALPSVSKRCQRAALLLRNNLAPSADFYKIYYKIYHYSNGRRDLVFVREVKSFIIVIPSLRKLEIYRQISKKYQKDDRELVVGEPYRLFYTAGLCDTAASSCIQTFVAGALFTLHEITMQLFKLH